MTSIENFLKENRIDEVECLVPDMAGIARGKILPARKFIKGMRGNGLRIPESVFVQTVNGDYPPAAYDNEVVEVRGAEVDAAEHVHQLAVFYVAQMFRAHGAQEPTDLVFELVQSVLEENGVKGWRRPDFRAAL